MFLNGILEYWNYGRKAIGGFIIPKFNHHIIPTLSEFIIQISNIPSVQYSNSI
jgi:hypothetical protein